MHWYIHGLKNYIAFSGRARRKEYWYFMLFYVLTLGLAAIADIATSTFEDSIGLGWVSAACFVATLLPMLGVSVRRLHDIGRSGWWLLLEFVPWVGSAILLVLSIFNGQPGPNAFGPDPKAAASPGAARGPGMPGPSVGWAGHPGSTTLRVLVLLGLIAVVLGGAGWFWWQQHRGLLVQAQQQGARSGAQLDEPGCLESAMDRVRASALNGFDASAVEGAWLGSCLQASRAVESFCEGVPPQSAVLPAIGWITSECARQGLAGQACTGLLQQVSNHCSSPRRASGPRL